MYESEALARCALMQQRDLSQDENEKTNLDEQIRSINLKIKQTRIEIFDTANLLVEYERLLGKMKSLHVFVNFLLFIERQAQANGDFEHN